MTNKVAGSGLSVTEQLSPKSALASQQEAIAAMTEGAVARGLDPATAAAIV